LAWDALRLLGVLLLGGSLTWVAATSLKQAEALRIRERQTAATDAIARAFNQELTRTTEAIRTAGLMMETNPELSREQFNGYVRKLIEHQLSINLVEWQPIVPARQLPQFVAEARATGLPDFEVIEPNAGGDGWRPVAARESYVVVRYAWPESYRTLGYDLGFSPIRMASKLQSQALGVPVASGTFEFMKEGKVRSGSAAIAISTTVFAADQRPRGYLAAVVDLPTLFRGATELARSGGLDLRVYPSATPGAEPVYVAEASGSDSPGPRAPAAAVTADDLRVPIEFARQKWDVVLQPRPGFYEGLQSGGSTWALLGGLGMTLLMAHAVHLLQRSRRRIEQAERAASSARSQLQVQTDRLLEAQHIAHLGDWQVDVPSGAVSWSDELYTMLGLPLGSPVPKVDDQRRFFPGDSWDRLDAALRGAVASGEGFELELEFIRPGGSRGWMLTRGAAKRGAGGTVVELHGMAMDITFRKQAELEAKSLAFFDPLTALPNRRLLQDRLSHALATCARQQRQGAVLFIDLDDFKTVNDTLGHQLGDLLLQQVARRLSTNVREGDTVGRLGGDEFVVVLENLGSEPAEAATHAESAGEKLLDVLRQPYQLGIDQHTCTASIGVTLFGDEDSSPDELLKRADVAMYRAKSAGRHTLRFFDQSMQAVVLARARLESDLRRALLEDGLLLHYQSQVDEGGTIRGAEVLLRMHLPERGLVPPNEFIPLAEETGLILPIGHWVLQSACAQLAAWSRRPEMAHLTIAVNVSPRQFQAPDFVSEVLALLDRTGVDPQGLKLELTEGILLDDVDDAVQKMQALRSRGVRFALDDFGTGFSSLGYLKRLPLDQLKIDKCFVDDLLVDPDDAAIARMIIVLAESLGLSVIAEGVERPEQREALRRLGCRAYQGYLFSRPLALAEFEALVCARRDAVAASLPP
jgi:diguanylate cyclase (GGDEF)-like protein